MCKHVYVRVCVCLHAHAYVKTVSVCCISAGAIGRAGVSHLTQVLRVKLLSSVLHCSHLAKPQTLLLSV